MKINSKRTVALFGASGVMGGELIRLVHGHPKLELKHIHSNRFAGKPISDIHQHLLGMTTLSFDDRSPVELARDADIVVVATRHGDAATICADLKDYEGIIIDLTGDHRLQDPSLYTKLYGFEHPNPAGLAAYQYNLPEVSGGKLLGSRRISNPGCFATAVSLAAAPLASLGANINHIFACAITGSSGSGSTLAKGTHHPHREGNLFAYKVFCHQHEPEIMATLQSLSSELPALTLATHSGPFVRGIHSTLHVKTANSQNHHQIYEYYKQYYSSAPFVRVVDSPPSIKNVIGSNYCDLHVAVRNDEIIVFTVIDNLVKGGAGQAIQNLNIALGFKESEGLWMPPLYP